MNRECPDLAVWPGPFANYKRNRIRFTRFASFVYVKDPIQLVLQQCLVFFCSPEIWTLPMKLCLHMQLWTAKAQIRLRWCAVWSGPSLPTFKIDCIENKISDVNKLKRWSESANFDYRGRHIFDWRGSCSLWFARRTARYTDPRPNCTRALETVRFTALNPIITECHIELS